MENIVKRPVVLKDIFVW